MNTVTISREYDFEAAHFLPNVPEGHKCRRMHGHSYRVTVYVTGPVQESGPEAGMVVDFGPLDDAWKALHAKWDHRPLNEIDDNPTVERMCPRVWEHFASLPRVKELGLSVRVHFAEGPRSGCWFPALGSP